MAYHIRLGHRHTITFFRWHPDDLPANRERYGVPLPNVYPAGGIVRHDRADGKYKSRRCISSVLFDTADIRGAFPDRAVWQVVSLKPLTLSPSLLCTECGDHGWIREGRWVPA